MTLISLLAAAWNRFSTYRDEARTLQELRELNPAQLRDIGVRLEGGRIVSMHEALPDAPAPQAETIAHKEAVAQEDATPRKEAIIIPPPETSR